MLVLAAARGAARSAFANAKHISRVGEWFPAAAALTRGVWRSIRAPSGVSYLRARPRSPMSPESTQQSCLLMSSPQ